MQNITKYCIDETPTVVSLLFQSLTGLTPHAAQQWPTTVRHQRVQRLILYPNVGSGTPGTAGGYGFIECKNTCNSNMHIYDHVYTVYTRWYLMLLSDAQDVCFKQGKTENDWLLGWLSLSLSFRYTSPQHLDQYYFVKNRCWNTCLKGGNAFFIYSTGIVAAIRTKTFHSTRVFYLLIVL